MNLGTRGVQPSDAGVASAVVNTGQQVGGSIGTSFLNTMAASASAAYLTAHLAVLRGLAGAGAGAGVAAGAVSSRSSAALAGLAEVHGYVTAFWWAAGIFAAGAVIAALLFTGPDKRPGRRS